MSVVSDASQATTVVATSSYFGTTRRSLAEINARWDICPKNARGILGSRDYSRHQEAATKALPHIFASAKHFHAKNSEGEASNSMQTSSPNMLEIFQRSRTSNGTWTFGICLIPLSFLNSSILMRYQWKIAREKGRLQECIY